MLSCPGPKFGEMQSWKDGIRNRSELVEVPTTTLDGGRRRGGRCVLQQREEKKDRNEGLRGKTLNVETLTGKIELMDRRKVDL